MFWALPAMFLGVVFAALPLHFLFKALLGERYAEYNVYSNMKYGVDGARVFPWIVGAYILAAGMLVAAGLNCYTQVTDRAIVIKAMLAVEKRQYSFDKVEMIAAVARFTAPIGNSVERPYHVIRFNDGATWTTRDSLRVPDPVKDREIMEFVAKASGKPIKEINSIEDLERKGTR
jgi:hypothetical protein